MPRLWPASALKAAVSPKAHLRHHTSHDAPDASVASTAPSCALTDPHPYPFPRSSVSPASQSAPSTFLKPAALLHRPSSSSPSSEHPSPSSSSAAHLHVNLDPRPRPSTPLHNSPPVSAAPVASSGNTDASHVHPAPLAVMPPPAPPPPPVPPRAPPEKRPRRVEVIIKLGGSAITDKSKRHSLHDNRFAQSIDTITRLHRSGIGLIVVHGAGSFGHFEAREHAVSSGAASPIGVSVTHASVTSLNVRVVHALLAKGIPAVGVAPLLVPARTRVDFIAALLDRGHLPVLHGDACYAGDGRTAIISGDALVASLAAAFPFVNRVVFLSDVPGLLKKPPSQYSKTVTSSGNKQAMIAMQPNSGAPTSTNSAPGSLNPATSHFTNNSYNESGGPTTKATFPSVNRLKAGQAPSGTASPFADDIIRRIVVNEAGDLKFDDSSTGEKNKSTKDINFDMLPHDTTGGISAKIVAAAKCAAESAGRVTAFIAQVGSQAADIALMNRPDRAVTDMCTRVCFEPEGALPPLHVDDVPAEPPISIAAAEGNKKSGRSSSVTRTSLPKRGSGLTERARRRGWFT